MQVFPESTGSNGQTVKNEQGVKNEIVSKADVRSGDGINSGSSNGGGTDEFAKLLLSRNFENDTLVIPNYITELGPGSIIFNQNMYKLIINQHLIDIFENSDDFAFSIDGMELFKLYGYSEIQHKFPYVIGNTIITRFYPQFLIDSDVNHFNLKFMEALVGLASNMTGYIIYSTPLIEFSINQYVLLMMTTAGMTEEQAKESLRSDLGIQDLECVDSFFNTKNVFFVKFKYIPEEIDVNKSILLKKVGNTFITNIFNEFTYDSDTYVLLGGRFDLITQDEILNDYNLIELNDVEDLADVINHSQTYSRIFSKTTLLSDNSEPLYCPLLSATKFDRMYGVLEFKEHCIFGAQYKETPTP